MAKEATAMNVEDLGTTATGAPRKRRAPNRQPLTIYVFVKNDPNTNRPTAAATFRDPRKMAEYFATSREEGSELLVVTPE
jgi:hypothetical protein